MTRSIHLTLAVMVALSTGAAAQTTQQKASAKDARPFGLAMGTPVKDLLDMGAKPYPEKPDNFQLDEVPSPHPAFESYLLFAGQKSGLCKVVALGKDVEGKSSGEEVRRAFDDMGATLEEKYGKPQRVDELASGSKYDKPKDWIKGVEKGDRRLMAVWTRAKGASKLPPNYQGILLEVTALKGQAYLRLQYEFTNFSSCVAERAREAL